MSDIAIVILTGMCLALGILLMEEKEKVKRIKKRLKRKNR